MAENKKTLAMKLAEITSSVSRIPKNGYNSFHNYKYATESDIKEVVREEMSKRSVILIGDEISNEKTEVKTRKGAIEYQIKITKEMSVIDGESGEIIKFKATGVGQDAGDKAQYKAETGLIKYALNNLFLIPTGDDPEREGKPLQPKEIPTITQAQCKALDNLIDSLVKIVGNTNEDWVLALNSKLNVNKDLKDYNINEFGIALNQLKNWQENYSKETNQTNKKAWD